MNIDDDYIPNVDKKIVLRNLLRLPLAVLCELSLKWSSKFGTAKTSHEHVIRSLERLKAKKAKRRTVAMKILLEYWPQGLNLFQLAQLDCHLIIYRPNSYYWKSSTAWNTKDEKMLLQIDPCNFISSLERDLAKLYMSHFYICEHPELPLIMCRVQLFDLNNEFLISSKHQPNDDTSLPEVVVDYTELAKKKTVSRKPYYLNFPLNSATIIHSPDTDLYSQLILQSVQRTISQRELLTLKPNEENPVRSLNSMHILHGVSRLANCLGTWASYANTNIEISPLDKPEKHKIVRGSVILDDESRSEEAAKNARMEKAMIRFKGSTNGVQSRKAYEAKRFNQRIYKLGTEEKVSMEEQITSKYESIIPVEKVQFWLKETHNDEQIGTICIKLQGKDVFGGLHELCDKGMIDVNKIPGWLTGENGIDSGTIVDGVFQKIRKKGGLI